ncbi:TPA_asm: RNA-directed RNA polymerase [ssRNA phage Esthiorhiza.4_13]|uniref:RNA-directed RNA polymerase n=2 Tax=Leviviricetes TaxID=2842243 RepID=A0A8S5KYE4_9VIRU|nr:RNA-directed RNA polymerase [ssRNA phage Esthiorhiza.4_13]DAD50188.1 TPA_asm: RNA-directed RNA polymerase [ssRNA phage Esthiorhiza.4_13]
MHTLYTESCAKCVADVFDLQDLITMWSRSEHEGDSFYTITLPSFCADFERSLHDGYVDPSLFRSFKKCGRIPSFLKGIVGRVFCSKTGRIIDVNSLSHQFDDTAPLIECLRQICLAFKKVAMPCGPVRDHAAIKSFISIEQSFEMFTLSGEDSQSFTTVSSMLWPRVVDTICINDVDPKHGPGATADRKNGNKKFIWSVWHERLEPFFPILGSGLPLSAYESEELQRVTFCPPDDELPVKVTPVPKTLKGPRIIAIEPCCMQYAQQGIARVLMDTLERSVGFSGHINFADQSINQALAMSSSIDGKWATIDLSDASDRVPRNLALQMFDSNPDLRDAIDACRSTRAKTPLGVIPLRKFASMGSALCFPVESMYFYTICVVALLGIRNLPVTYRSVRYVQDDIFVYGDDIIVPSNEAAAVLDYLQKYHCKVNKSKTFYTGKFRESCGLDAFNGYQVTPVYIRSLRPKNRQQVSELISTVATANLLYQKGLWKTANLLFSYVEKYLGRLPYVKKDSPALGRVTFKNATTISRWNSRYFRFEFKAWVPASVHRVDELDGYSALSKSLSLLGRYNNVTPYDRDPLHMERSALYGAVALKRRWVASD